MKKGIMIWRLTVAACAVAAAWLPINAQAQPDAQLTQYYEVPSAYNPSAIGRTHMLRMRVGGRMQWVGAENAPHVFMGAADMPLPFCDRRIGVGMVVQSYGAGPCKWLQAGLQGAYRMRLPGGELSAGLQAGIFDKKFQSEEPEQDIADPVSGADIHHRAFDMGVGLSYDSRNFMAGISCAHLGSAADRRFYFMVMGNIPIKNTLFEIMPSAMVGSDFSYTTADTSLRARYRRLIAVGVGYRWNDAVYATIGAEYKNLFICYAYEHVASGNGKGSSGSHEIIAGYSVRLDFSSKSRHKHKSVRLM